MPLADVLLTTKPSSHDDAALRYAVEMAAAFKAHLTGVCYSTESDVDGTALPEVAAGRVGRKSEHHEPAALRVRARLESLANSAKISLHFYSKSCDSLAAAEDFARRLRVTDIGVLTQHTAGQDRDNDLLLEAALFRSGRPIIMVPRDYPDRYSTRRVLIAWDGTPHASRAVAAAMPLLQDSEIEVFTVEEIAKADDFSGQGMVQHLRRHGLNAGLGQRNQDDISGAILQEADLFRASLLIMGGYGHSRLREFIFGGVTRNIMSKARIPVLMAH